MPAAGAEPGGQCLGGGRGHCTKKWQQLRPALDRRPLARQAALARLGLSRVEGDWQKEFWPLARRPDGRRLPGCPPLSIFATQETPNESLLHHHHFLFLKKHGISRLIYILKSKLSMFAKIKFRVIMLDLS